MQLNPTTHLVLVPVLLPLAGAAAALLLRRRQRLQALWSLGVMLASFLASAWLLRQVVAAREPLVFQSGGWAAPFGITLVADPLSATLALMSQLVLATGFLYALGAKDRSVRYPTFFPLFLALASGLTGAFLTGDLFNLFVFSELLVLSGTVLTAISDDRYGPEAAYKYLYISLLAGALLLLANGSLYVSYGTLNMADLARRVSADPSQPLLPAAIALLTAAFMIKSAVFPFHFWQPDFHTAAPTAVSAMLSSVVVKLGVYGFLRMNTLLFVEQAPGLKLLLIVLGVVGIAFGGLSAIGTHNVKRMLAYSTLAQVGFILVGIGWGSTLSIAAAIVFTVNHSLIKAAMLMLAGAMASRARVKSAAFEVVTGLGKKAPLAGGLFFIGGMALAGIPPTNGFISKLMLFRSGVQGEQYLWLLLIAAGGTLSLIYSLRAFERIWLAPGHQASSEGEAGEQIEAPGEPGGVPAAAGESPQPINEGKKSGDRLLAPGVLIALALALGVWAEPLVNLSLQAAGWLANSETYIQAVLGG